MRPPPPPPNLEVHNKLALLKSKQIYTYTTPSSIRPPLHPQTGSMVATVQLAFSVGDHLLKGSLFPDIYYVL